MIASIILLQLAVAPPVPRPEPDRLEAAMLLWSKHPPSKLAKDIAVDYAVSEATTQALFRVGIQASPRMELTKRFIAKYDQLRPLVAAHIPTDRKTLDQLATECAVDGISRSMTASEIAEVDRFTSTPTGQKFWEATRLGIEPLQRCYKQVLDLRVTVADYLAVGLKPPKEPDSPPPGSFLS